MTKLKDILPGDRKKNKTIPVSHSKDHPDVQKLADKIYDRSEKKMFGGVGMIGDSSKKSKKMQAKAEKEAKKFMDTVQTMKSKEMTEKELENHLPDDKIQQVLDNAENRAKTKMTKILSTGKIVHSYIEKYVKGEKYIKPEDPVVLDCFNKFVKWWDKNGFTLIASEKIVCLPGGFAGTIDLVAKDKEGLVWLIDIKTNNGIFVSHFHQVHGYKYAYEKQTKQKINRMCIVRLPKNGSKIEVRRVLSKKQHMLAFMGLLSAYKSVRLFEEQTIKYNQKRG